MASDWIAVDYETPEKPEMLAVAERLQIEPDIVFARWFRLWRWADANLGADGHAKNVTLSRLSHVAGLPGLAEAFAEIGGDEAWLQQTDDGVVFRDFAKWNSNSKKLRMLAAERKRRQRDREGQTGDRSHADVTPMSRGSHDFSASPLSPPPDPPSNPPTTATTTESVSPPLSPPLPRGGRGSLQRTAYLLLENHLPDHCRPKKTRAWVPVRNALVEWLKADEPPELLAMFLQELPRLKDANGKPWGPDVSRALILGSGYREWKKTQSWDPDRQPRERCPQCHTDGIPQRLQVDGEHRCIVCLEPLESPEPDVPP